MATTKQGLEEEGKRFGDSFNEESAPPVEQSEDEVFGLNLPAADDTAAEGDGETDGSTVAVQADPNSLPAEPPADEVAAAQEQAAAGEDGMPEKTQAEKSWEGRLRAREAELKALSAELEAKKNTPPEASAETTSEEAAETPAEESAEGVGGEAEEAMRQLSEDFGPEFVKMICAIASKKAAEAAGEQVAAVGQTVKEVIDNINDSRSRRHFEEIFDAHPDFAEVADSDPFKEFVAAMPADAQADTQRVIEGGSSREINRLLRAFKDSAKTGASDDASLDGAEGVRSTGLRLPVQPSAGSDDFSAAWDEHA